MALVDCVKRKRVASSDLSRVSLTLTVFFFYFSFLFSFPRSETDELQTHVDTMAVILVSPFVVWLEACHFIFLLPDQKSFFF